MGKTGYNFAPAPNTLRPLVVVGGNYFVEVRGNYSLVGDLVDNHHLHRLVVVDNLLHHHHLHLAEGEVGEGCRTRWMVVSPLGQRTATTTMVQKNNPLVVGVSIHPRNFVGVLLLEARNSAGVMGARRVHS